MLKKSYLVLLSLITLANQSNASPTTESREYECTHVPPMCYKLISRKYIQMRLPNMLNQSRYSDIATALRVWQPLLNSRTCNAGDQLKYFLCFTYAPVCVDTLISPCKSLCKAVRNSCDPVMRQHNYTWPVFFNCDQQTKFLNDNSQMCINLTMLSLRRVQIECSCNATYTTQTLRSLICRSDFVISAHVTRSVRDGNEINATVSRVLFQKSFAGSFLPQTSVPLPLVQGNRHCRCDRIGWKNRRRRFLIIGRNVGGRRVVDGMKKMENKQEILQIIRQC